jgi:hypothetical protein
MEVTSIYLASYLLGTRSNLIVRNGPDRVSRYLDACPAFAVLDLSVLSSFNESKPCGKCNVRVRQRTSQLFGWKGTGVSHADRD